MRIRMSMLICTVLLPYLTHSYSSEHFICGGLVCVSCQMLFAFDNSMGLLGECRWYCCHSHNLRQFISNQNEFTIFGLTQRCLHDAMEVLLDFLFAFDLMNVSLSEIGWKRQRERCERFSDKIKKLMQCIFIYLVDCYRQVTTFIVQSARTPQLIVLPLISVVYRSWGPSLYYLILPTVYILIVNRIKSKRIQISQKPHPYTTTNEARWNNKDHK